MQCKDVTAGGQGIYFTIQYGLKITFKKNQIKAAHFISSN